MNHTDLIKRLRDALQQASDCLSLEVILQGRDPDLAEWHAAIAEADAHLKSGGWVRVEDALPVVPEGEHAVAIAVFGGADVVRTYWQAQKTSFVGNYSHWRPDPLPNPPEQTMNTVVQEYWNGDEDMARGHAAITLEMSTEVDAPPLLGCWRHGNGAICCGTLRIAREDFDTQPSRERKDEILDWVCSTLNAAVKHHRAMIAAQEGK